MVRGARSIAVIAAIASVVAACSTEVEVGDGATTTSVPVATDTVSTTTVPTPVVMVGAERLVNSGFIALAGDRVALIANQTSVVGGRHLIDVLHEAPDVELVAVFAPEHGVRGTEGAGAEIADEVDAATGVPILSLYGDTRRPTPEMLDGVDTIVFDLQDVGGRFYTYISTMGLAMQAAGEAGLRFVVLDRPDPSGLVEPSGFVLEAEHVSFVGQFPIAAAYAMTPGELARAIVGEGWIDGVEDLHLDVVPLGGWQRGMSWNDTGLDWIPPSPGLQTATAAVVYLGTVLFEATSISFGGGTRLTFEQIGAPWADAVVVAADLGSRRLPGVEFAAVSFTPGPLPGRTAEPRLNGEQVHGVRITITDPATFDPVEVGVHILEAFWNEARRQERGDEVYIARPSMMTLLAGTTRLVDELAAGAGAADVIAGWEDELAAFDDARRRYLLYPEPRP